LDGKRKRGWWVLPLVAALVIALDQWTKYLVHTNLGLYETYTPIPALKGWFEFHYITNTGAAFGLFQDGNLFFIGIAIVVSVVVLFYYWHLPAGQWLLRLGLGLQLGGAVGNLIDRLRVGNVIDFIHVRYWFVFNLADASLVVGVALMALIFLRQDLDEQQVERSAGGEAEGAGEAGEPASG
jgi:signal peptidase II